MFCSFPECPSHILVCERQQVRDYPHNLHLTKYLVLLCTFSYNTKNSEKKKHFRLVPVDTLSDSGNFEGYSKVIPG